MSIILSSNQYGKGNVKVVKVIKDGKIHSLKELNVQVLLEGTTLEAAYLKGDNSVVVPTDTVKNTVYILAKTHSLRSIEEFGANICEHFLKMYPHISAVHVDIVEHLWARMNVGKDRNPHQHSFQRASPEKRTVKVNGTRKSIEYESGLDDLLVLKTTGSGFENFHLCKHTTLKPTDDRILSTIILCKWKYNTKNVDFNATWDGIRQEILDVFAMEYSKAVQETIWLMGKRILEKYAHVEHVWFSLPNKHVFIYDLARFGLENNNEVFQPVSDPNGLIEGTISRQRAKL